MLQAKGHQWNSSVESTHYKWLLQTATAATTEVEVTIMSFYKLNIHGNEKE